MDNDEVLSFVFISCVRCLLLENMIVGSSLWH